MSKTIIIGDVHGMLREVEKLLDLVSYKEGDRVICVGDLMDKGPHSVEAVRFFRERSFECVLGNHEEWYVRYAKHEAVRSFTGKPNPMKKNPVKMDNYERLKTEDLLWLNALPPFIRIGAGWVVVHGGLLPGVLPEHMKVSQLIRVRWVHSDTKQFAALTSDMKRPENTTFWTEFYEGKDNVIFGHEPLDGITVSENPGAGKTYGIDTGCVYGNALSCLVFERVGPYARPEMASVRSERGYAERADYEE